MFRSSRLNIYLRWLNIIQSLEFELYLINSVPFFANSCDGFILRVKQHTRFERMLNPFYLSFKLLKLIFKPLFIV